MKLSRLIALPIIAVTPVAAEDIRQLGAHEHGVGALNIAFDGAQIAMEFQAPGADIVGFEYAATTVEDRAKIDAALAILSDPLALFTPPAAANCTVTEALAELETEDSHDDHDDAHEGDDVQSDHTEFHAQYLINCANPSAVTEITFTYFNLFPAALEVEGQVISDRGAAAFEVDPNAPILDLTSLF